MNDSTRTREVEVCTSPAGAFQPGDLLTHHSVPGFYTVEAVTHNGRLVVIDPRGERQRLWLDYATESFRKAPQWRLDSRLRRVIRDGYTTAYATRDGHFQIENGLAGMRGGERTPWTVIPRSSQGDSWLQAHGWIARRTKRQAVETLRQGIYAEPHGWAHVPMNEVWAVIDRQNYERADA